MKKILKKSIFLFICLSAFYCKNEDKKTNIVSKNDANVQFDLLAKAYCQCSEEIVNLNKKMQKLHDEEKFEEMGDLLSEIELKSQQQNTCKTNLETQYGTKIDTNSVVLSMIKNICPDLGGYIESGKKETE
jgi:hypothetical protein